MSKRTILTYAERDRVLQQRALIRNDEVFVSCVKKKYPTISDVTLGDKNLAIWSIAVGVAKRCNKMHAKSLSKHDYNNYDRVALAHYDPRYLQQQFNMTKGQVKALRESTPKPIIDVRAPAAGKIESFDASEVSYVPEMHGDPKKYWRNIAVGFIVFAVAFTAFIYGFAV